MGDIELGAVWFDVWSLLILEIDEDGSKFQRVDTCISKPASKCVTIRIMTVLYPKSSPSDESSDTIISLILSYVPAM